MRRLDQIGLHEATMQSRKICNVKHFIFGGGVGVDSLIEV